MTALSPDRLVFGRRLRHLRKDRDLTLATLGDRVGKPASYLSQLETGKLEPRLSLIDALAEALGVTRDELMSSEAPSRRAQLEIAFERAQEEPLYRSLGLAYVKPSTQVPEGVLEHLVGLYKQLSTRAEIASASPEGARHANAELRAEMRSRDNYFAEIEAVASEALTAVGWDGTRAVSEGTIAALAAHFGFTIQRVRDLPRQTRSISDLRHRTIYIPQRNAVPTRSARSIILETLGHFALGHEDPTDFAHYLRTRVEANYFAGAILAPEAAAVPFLQEAKARRDLSIEDLKEVFYISYEMAAHRFTNLATRHLGIPVHFVRADEEGVIWKAYENDGIPFPTDPLGAIEGQRACRRWGTRTAFDAEDVFDIHYQYTETPAGTYWSATHVEADRPPYVAITVGTTERNAVFFRGRPTTRREQSLCPGGGCCEPTGVLHDHWAGMVWPSPREHSHVLAARPVGIYPGVELTEVYEFLERRSAGDGSIP
jgi:predicted transcriptional regulator/DNA-binding XRE family transcriptional regulator